MEVSIENRRELFHMHVPPPPGRPEQAGEPEVLTGPGGPPSRRAAAGSVSRKRGLAIAVASALTAALVSAGAVFVLLGGAGGGSGTSPSGSTQGARQAPEAGEGSGEGSGEAPEDAATGPDGAADGSGTADDSGAADGPGSGEDTAAGPGDSGAPGEGDTGARSDKPATSTAGKKGQDSRQEPEQPASDLHTDPRSDGPPGFSPPNPPIGGY
ncbi:hypothetical protein Pve01_45330 [Planomonospora venezuelensis]|nr:hypothetical protein Pve01_45330 [Planomonospora venezuelensis]